MVFSGFVVSASMRRKLTAAGDDLKILLQLPESQSKQREVGYGVSPQILPELLHIFAH